MTTEELHEKIQECDCSPTQRTITDILNIMERLNGNVLMLEMKVEKLEIKLEQLDRESHRTANIASCLANGIQPD